ncbi:PA14 domain-containing protein [Marinobacter bryozoorum]|uniref:PA14 domain-containing protein n=1 Tax=Marinobacter bryozoorum TaxID=256324 RepID=UPI0020064361|nr:PA14 domain-containing protein [Marinobacter bryozoorum]MCK7544042.1 PA14 domain-containing protein [Marinobacter bryozoorum]
MSFSKLTGLVLIAGFISGCQSWHRADLDALPPTAALPATSEAGIVEVWYWDNLPGNEVGDLTSHASYPDKPDSVVEINSLESESNRGQDYGSLVRGYVTPPTDGRYRFFVTGDDETQFWLSDSSSSSDITLIASVPGWTNPGEYSKYTSQTSSEITLSGDSRYYFEIRHKEGRGGDHFTVAWEGPGFGRTVVDSNSIASFAQSTSTDSGNMEEAHTLGYRVGFFDAQENLEFNPSYPMLDEDRDELYDNWEVAHGLDPTNPDDATSDADDDLLTALDEFWRGTDPDNADTDGDGIPDGAEFAYGIDPLNPADAQEDLDGDGFSNIEEYAAGTDIDDPEAFPAQEETAQQLINGFVGQYFFGQELDDLVTLRNDVSIDFEWGNGGPTNGLTGNNFSIRWVGKFYPPHGSGTREYQFTTRTDDGVRLYVNNELVIDQWQGQAATSFSATANLEAGTTVPLSMEYFEGRGDATAQLTITDLSNGTVVSSQDTVRSPDPAAQDSTADTQGDGIPDTWAVNYGLDPWRDNADTSLNDQGISNLEAYQSGLDPRTLEDVSEPVGTAPTPPQTEDPPEDPATGTASISWTAPLTRVDGSSLSLSEIQSYEVRYGQSENSLDQTRTVDAGETSVDISGLETGTWYFSVRVIDNSGIRSVFSDTVEYVVQ